MEDFLIELHIEGFTSRLKRLSDTLLYSTRDLYNTMDIDIEPNWNLIFRLLQEHNEITITEIAEKLQFSHPAVVKVVNKMKKNGYLETFTDKDDRRRQILRLSQKAVTKMQNMEELWDMQNKVLTHLLGDSPNLLQELKEIEQKLNTTDYKTRVLKQLKE